MEVRERMQHGKISIRFYDSIPTAVVPGVSWDGIAIELSSTVSNRLLPVPVPAGSSAAISCADGLASMDMYGVQVY